MAEKKQAESKSEEKSKGSGSKIPFGNCEEMFKMMRDSCEGGESAFNCCTVMQKLFGSELKEESKQ